MDELDMAGPFEHMMTPDFEQSLIYAERCIGCHEKKRYNDKARFCCRACEVWGCQTEPRSPIVPGWYTSTVRALASQITFEEVLINRVGMWPKCWWRCNRPDLFLILSDALQDGDYPDELTLQEMRLRPDEMVLPYDFDKLPHYPFRKLVEALGKSGYALEEYLTSFPERKVNGNRLSLADEWANVPVDEDGEPLESPIYGGLL